MTQHEASRTLVKSPPELWAECSDAASLARHLGQFGEIRITRLEPETAVAWEGEEISGTVRLEPTGWGTKVILTARWQDPELPAPEEPDVAVPEPPPSQAQPTPEPAPVAEMGPPQLEPVEASADAGPVEPPSDARRSSKRSGFAWLRDFFGFGPAPDQVVLEPLPVPSTAPTEQDETELLPQPMTESEPEPVQMASPESAEEAAPAADGVAPPDEAVPAADEALSAALDSLGQAHHRPFSRG
jgi:hypothetical protein